MTAPAALSVSALLRHLRQRLEDDELLQNVWVKGEISNWKRAASGHCYFTLKDDQSAIRCVMFRSSSDHLKFAPRDGMAVLAGGHVSLYERDGNIQLYVAALEPDGVGSLYLALEQIKARLATEGLFDEGRKRPLPAFPRRIALITSPTGAALRDMVTVARRRFPGVRLVLLPVLVQGDEAPGQIAQALSDVALVPEVDVVIVGRGGGSIEELWAFNTEIVARAIAACHLPVISAVGHETDFTVADLVADRRAPTPSAAAELAVPSLAELQWQLENRRRNLILAVRSRLRAASAVLERLSRSPALQRPTYRLDRDRQRLDDVQRRLWRASPAIRVGRERELLEQRRARLALLASKSLREWKARRDQAAGRLNALSPLAVLARGYSLTRLADGSIVRSIASVSAGDRVTVQVADGSFGAEVLATARREEGAG